MQITRKCYLKIYSYFLQIITNTELIDINQDPLGKQVWLKYLKLKYSNNSFNKVIFIVSIQGYLREGLLWRGNLGSHWSCSDLCELQRCLAGVAGASRSGRIRGRSSQQVKIHKTLYFMWQVYSFFIPRFDDDELVDMDWSIDALIPDGSYTLRDLWTHEDVGTITVPGDRYSAILAEHAHWAFKLTPA